MGLYERLLEESGRTSGGPEPDPLRVFCRSCKADEGWPCATPSGKAKRDYHQARVDDAHARRERRMR